MHIYGVMSPERFPPMRQEPAAAAILACLDRLATPGGSTAQSSDDDEDDEDDSWGSARARQADAAVARYLASIVRSDLAWLPDEDAREAVWAAASRVLAARCGRAAMGAMTRVWQLADAADEDAAVPVSLALDEPALVGDHLGFKTWGTAFVLARMLPSLAATSPGLAPWAARLTPSGKQHRASVAPAVLELGAGTGLLGLAAAALWRADVVLSDLPAIVPNLAANVARNAAVVEARGGRARAGVLRWGADRGGDGDDDDDDDDRDPQLFPRDHQFPLVLAADPLYDDDHPALLAGAVDQQLAQNGDGDGDDQQPPPRAVIMVPLRDAQTKALAAQFVAAMAARGLVPVDEGAAAGHDSDWAGEAAGSQFTCAWWVFGRVNGKGME